MKFYRIIPVLLLMLFLDTTGRERSECSNDLKTKNTISTPHHAGTCDSSIIMADENDLPLLFLSAYFFGR